MRTISITVNNAAHCTVSKQADVNLILPVFGYQVKGWRVTKDSSGPVSRQKFVFGNKKREFLTGFLPRLQKFCLNKGYDLNITYDFQWPIETIEENPQLEGITIRPDQLDFIRSVHQNDHRGVLVAPTRTGKSVVMFGLIKSYPTCKFLVLAHTTGIVIQHYEDAQRFGFNPYVIGAGFSNKHLAPLTIATWQSFKDIPVEQYIDYFEGVLIDECHHVCDIKSTYSQILQRMLAPIRVGFTATLPSEQKERLMLEGLIGPVAKEMTIKEAHKLDIIAKPIVIVRKVVENKKVKEINGYKGAYREGIVRNRAFHRMVLIDAMKHLNIGQSVLIFVWEKEHGENLQEAAHKIFNIDMSFVYSGTEAQQRNQIRILMNTQAMGAIATACWREGITIPSLGAVINAAGGKKELVTLQAVGRGLGKTATKNKVYIYDYFNPNNINFISHFGERLCLFMDNGWLAGQE